MYVDAGVFVLPLLYDERRLGASACAAFLRSVAEGTRPASTATITWDEVAYVIRRLAGPVTSVQKAQQLLAIPRLKWLPVDESGLRRAASLYASVPIRPRDALHAACALENGETEIVSEDRVYDRVPGLRRIWPPR